LAYAHAQQGSGALSSLTAESALVIAPKDCGDLKAGDRLQAIVQGLPRRADPGFAG
jgi:molybdopterin biosynthesis enzyme